MRQLSSSELADTLKVSRGRVSQYVSEGKLAGCFEGDGRARRFDLVKVAQALGRTLDPGQMMGNGAQTRQALRDLATEDSESAGQDEAQMLAPLRSAGKPAAMRGGQADDSELSMRDPDRYEMARTLKAEEEARKLRRQNEEAEGQYVLASAVAQQTTRLIGREVQALEAVLQAGARAVADRLGVDYRAARSILVEVWREHRARRATELGAEAAVASLSPDEAAGDI
jgi:hypothetical protein